jgi:hypothetical protein
MAVLSSHSNVKADAALMERSMVTYASDYARRGIPVFPCKRADKSPLTKNGFKNATCDLAKISRMWRQRPNAMIGVPTGPTSGIDVIDIDVKPDEHIDGRKFLPNWKSLSSTIVRTPSGGGHIHEAVHDLAHDYCAFVATAPAWRDQRFDQFPFVVGEVAGIA